MTLFEDELQTGLFSWNGTHEAALARLENFLPSAGKTYAAQRNFDFGPDDRSNISCLSPWIRHRLLLEEEVVRKTFARHSLKASEKFIQEVFWRAYFKGWLEQRPAVWRHYQSDLHNQIKELHASADLRSSYESAIAGHTGIDCFDAWAHELVQTGYLHNHARMWFASIWIFTLRLPWQLGADFFYRHLLDGDPASNTLSWRWVGGLHTKGKHYVARVSNIEKYTNGRFLPEGLVTDPLPLAEDRDYPLQPIPIAETLSDGEAFGLILTEEDCNPETLPLPQSPRGICSLLATRARSPLEVSGPVRTFAQQAVEDAVHRSESHFQTEATNFETKESALLLINWARELGVSTLATAYTPVGPVNDILEAARPALDDAGIRLLQVRRVYDSGCWPHATRGFFKLKEKIPRLVRELGLG